MTGPPAVHRFPGSMAGRVQAVARRVVDQYDGSAATLWTTASDGAELLARLRALPGFGDAEGADLRRPPRQAARGPAAGMAGGRRAYGEEGSRRSVADVVDAASLSRGAGVQAGARRRRGRAEQGDTGVPDGTP